MSDGFSSTTGGADGCWVIADGADGCWAKTADNSNPSAANGAKSRNRDCVYILVFLAIRSEPRGLGTG